jgi:hypothetical protein
MLRGAELCASPTVGAGVRARGITAAAADMRDEMADSIAPRRARAPLGFALGAATDPLTSSDRLAISSEE